ncbi:kinase [Gammaproteobacteria bacterium]|nr:kinase [Gammaproteobacteria bacterium]
MIQKEKSPRIIMTQTPFRVSFIGGGTDMPDYFNNHQGGVLGTTINKYTYVVINSLERLLEKKIRTSYSKLELVDEIEDVEDDYVRTILKANMNIYKNDFYDIHTFGDLPSGTGIGSSSSFVVGMLNAVHNLNSINKKPKELAEEAIHIERVLLDEKGGWQDQIFAAYGGLNYINFHNNSYEINKLSISDSNKSLLEDSCMLFFTNIQRSSSEIQEKVFKKTNLEEKQSYFQEIYRLSIEGKKILESIDNSNEMLKEFGEVVNQGWHLKSSLSDSISNETIDQIYQSAIDAGALGGKACGAGGGGFILFIVPHEYQNSVRKSLSKLKEIEVKFDDSGSTVVFARNK